MNFIFKFLYNFFLGLDQFLNVLLLGDPDESVSGRLGRAYLSGAPKWWVKPIMAINDALWSIAGEEDHSINSVEIEEDMKKELWHWYYKG